MSDSSQIRVWDPLVRFFHWSLVSAFFIAFVIEENVLTMHIWAGYLILMLISIRIVWGFIGTHYARFSNFLYPPKVIKAEQGSFNEHEIRIPGYGRWDD